jgi:hypothetical protein
MAIKPTEIPSENTVKLKQTLMIGLFEVYYRNKTYGDSLMNTLKLT